MAFKPYRHELIAATPEAVADVIRAQSATGARAIEPTEQALERIAQTKLAHADRAVSWATHPDERVGMAMLEAHEKRKIFGHQSADRVRCLLVRQVQLAQTTGIFWTPILDKIATLGLWTKGGIGQSKERAEKLVPWIREQKDPAQIHDILRFQANEIWEVVAREATTLDDGVLEALMSRSKLVPILVKNPAVRGERLKAIRNWILDQLRSVTSTVFDRGVAASDVLATLKALLDGGWEADAEFVATLRRLAREKEPLRGDAARLPYASRELSLQALLMFDEEVGLEKWVEMHEVKTLPERVLTEVTRRTRGHDELELRIARKIPDGLRFQEYLRRGFCKDPELAERALASSIPSTISCLVNREVRPDLAEKAFAKLLEMQAGRSYADDPWRLLIRHAFAVDQLQRMYRKRRSETEAVASLITHPAAGPALWREIARENRSPQIRKVLASVAEARRDEEVRRVLLNSNIPDVIYALCSDRNPEELPALIQKLANKGDRRVLGVLKDAPDAVLEKLDPTLLTPWLTSKKSDLRMEAILLVGRFKAVMGDRQRGERPRSR